MATPEARVVTVRPRTILLVLGITVLVGLVLVLGYLAWHVLTWILIWISFPSACGRIGVRPWRERTAARGVLSR